ncbi:MAG: OmpH family outer membrane protein [Pseudomonadota bacterium]
MSAALKQTAKTACVAYVGAILFCAAPALAETPADDGGIYVVAYERVLTEIDASQELRRAEAELTATLQKQIDDAKAQLAAEEAALARTRSSLTPDEFEQQATDFDRRVRLLRRIATERAKLLQRSFEEAREEIVRKVRVEIGGLRNESGARVILPADNVLAWDPEVDLTDRLITLINASITDVDIPEMDFSTPILEPPAETDPNDQQQ